MLTLLALACSPTETNQNGGELPSCGADEVLDGNICRPESCGIGLWGDIGDADVFVNASAAEGGDGSVDRPVRSLQAGVDLAGGRTVAVASGTYEEVLELTEDHDGLQLRGRCRELVVIDGSEGDQDQPTLYLHGDRKTSWVVDGVTITGGRYAGVVVEDAGDLSMARVAVSKNTNGGLAAIGGDVTVTLTESQFVDTAPESGGSGGGGIYAVGSILTLTDGLVQGNYAAGVVASGRGALVTLDRTEVLDTILESRVNGGAVIAIEGADVYAVDSTIQGNRLVGVLALNAGTEVTLERTNVMDTEVDLGGSGGTGAAVQDGARLTATDCVFSGNHESGIAVQQADSEAILLRTQVLDTLTTDDGFGGAGLTAGLGGSISATECIVSGNHAYGVSVDGQGSIIILEDTDVLETQTEGDGRQGGGIAVTNGGNLTAVGGGVEGNHMFGILVSDTGSSAALRGVSIVGTVPDTRPASGRGLTAQFGGIVAADSCTIQGNRNVGVFADGDDTHIVLTDVLVLDTEPDEEGGGGRGIDVQNGAQLEAFGSTVDGNYESGVLVDTATVVLEDSVIRSTLRDWASESAIGLTAQVGAVVTATRTTIEGTEGPGIDVIASTLDCVACTIVNNQFAGAVLHGGTLTLTDSVVSGNAPSPVDGGGVGIFAYNDPSTPVDSHNLTVSQTTVGPHAYAAVWLAAPGDFTIEDSDLEGGPGVALTDWLSIHGNAVYAVDSEVTLRGNTLSSSSQATVLLHGSRATLDGNDWSALADGLSSWDIVQQYCGETAPLLETDGAGHTRLCTEDAELMVQALNFAIYFDEADVF